MSADYLMNGDEGRRAHALDEALRNLPLEASTSTVLARTREFEAYLAGKEEPVPLQLGKPIEIKANPDARKVVGGDPDDPLPQPSHVTRDDSGNCLGCEWAVLRRKIKKARRV